MIRAGTAAWAEWFRPLALAGGGWLALQRGGALILTGAR